MNFFPQYSGYNSVTLGNDDLVKSLIFDAAVTNDFENQKSPKGRGQTSG